MRTFKIYALSNFQMYNTALLIIITMLDITSPGLIYFITGSLWLLNTFSHFTHLPPPTSDNNQSVFFVSKSSIFLVCFLVWFLDSIYKWDHVVFVFFHPTSLSIMPWKCIHGVANGKISFFLYDCIIFHCVYSIPHTPTHTPQLLYPLAASVCWLL